MNAENWNQAMSKLAQAVEANTKAIEENGKAVAEMVNLLRAKVIQLDEFRCIDEPHRGNNMMCLKWANKGGFSIQPRRSPISDGECFYVKKI